MKCLFLEVILQERMQEVPRVLLWKDLVLCGDRALVCEGRAMPFRLCKEVWEP